LRSILVHVSPFGRFEDRESYLATVETPARRSRVELTVKDIIASRNQAAVRFENRARACSRTDATVAQGVLAGEMI
jgi:hypothetical protein